MEVKNRELDLRSKEFEMKAKEYEQTILLKYFYALFLIFIMLIFLRTRELNELKLKSQGSVQIQQF